MPDLPHYDVVIAGAGPAGCASAMTLQQAGHRVCLVDHTPDNSRKVGESLPGATIRLLKRLGIAGLDTLLAPEDFKRCVANASAWGSSKWVYQDALLNPEGGGWHINRTHFEAALRERALESGVPIYQARIDQIKTMTTVDTNETNHLALFTNQDTQLPDGVRATWLVDATGRTAFISRKFRLTRTRLDDQMAAIYWVKAHAGDQDHATRIKSVPEGWWYTALLPDASRIISFQGLPLTVAGMIKHPALFFDQLKATSLLPALLTDPVIIDRKATDAGMIYMPQVSSHGLVCVGDAALALDPLSSQGIFFALYSGIKGAEAISKSLANPVIMPKVLQNYQMQVNQVYTANQRSRLYFYQSEQRYASELYWQQRIGHDLKSNLP